MTQAELLQLLQDRFGLDPLAWAFVCPECGDVASGEDFRQALREHPEKCNWCAYGLFPGPLEVNPRGDRSKGGYLHGSRRPAYALLTEDGVERGALVP
jgi:hypothetical protein